MPEKYSRNPESVVMSVALEMKHAIVALAGSRMPSDTRESMIARAARRADISIRQAKALFYGEYRDPRASIVEKVRAAIKEDTAETHAARLCALEATLAHVDPEFFGPAVQALREAARALGGEAHAADAALGSVDGEEP